MSGICGRHRERNPDCRLCNLLPRDILPDFDKKVAEAEATGLHTCSKCGYVFYLTIDYCPHCSKKSPPQLRRVT